MAVFFGGGDFTLLEALAGFRDGIDAAGAGARMLEAVTAWSWTLACGPAERCVALALRALAGTELLDGDHTFCLASAMATLVAADRDEAVAQWETIRAATHRRGSLFSALTVNLWEGFTLLRRGDLADAEALVRQSAHETTLWGVGDYAGASTGCGILAEVLVERGDLAGAEAVLAAGPPLVRANDGENHMRRARAALALARGATDEALAAADDYAVNEGGMTNPAWQPWRSLRALALARAGREEEALADARAELELASAYGAPRALGRALRVLGTLERDRGIDHLRAAVDTLAASPARLEHAYALAALGSALRRARRPNDARAPLREALDLATQCGADPLAEHARAELHAAGARPRAEALQGVAALTPSELRIAGLAADGSTNKAIAQTLFVTPKTVELHLSNAYRKLGIRSRHELGAALART
jgi:DNA-binding NarL/FixJ family response regulator